MKGRRPREAPDDWCPRFYGFEPNRQICVHFLRPRARNRRKQDADFIDKTDDKMQEEGTPLPVEPLSLSCGSLSRSSGGISGKRSGTKRRAG